MGDYVFNVITGVLARLGKWIVLGIVNSSYWIMLFCCMFALIMYIAGLKKAGKYVPISFILFCFLQAIKELLV